MANTKVCESTADKWFIGSYRHLQPMPRGNLYHAIRLHHGLSQGKAAASFGVSLNAWQYRERSKRLYHTAEVIALYEWSKMKPQEFIELLRSIA